MDVLLQRGALVMLGDCVDKGPRQVETFVRRRHFSHQQASSLIKVRFLKQEVAGELTCVL